MKAAAWDAAALRIILTNCVAPPLWAGVAWASITWSEMCSKCQICGGGGLFLGRDVGGGSRSGSRGPPLDARGV